MRLIRSGGRVDWRRETLTPGAEPTIFAGCGYGLISSPRRGASPGRRKRTLRSPLPRRLAATSFALLSPERPGAR